MKYKISEVSIPRVDMHIFVIEEQMLVVWVGGLKVSFLKMIQFRSKGQD